MTALLLCVLVFMTALYFRLEHLHKEELRRDAAYIAAGIEQSGADFLFSCLPDDESISKITLFSPSGELLCSVGGGTALSEDDRANLFQAALNMKSDVKTSPFSIHSLLILSDGAVLCVSGQTSPMMILIVEMLYPFVLILIVSMLLSLLWASKVSKKIIRPIMQIDPDNPDGRGVYVEFLPFIEKLRTKNIHVREQIEQIREEHEKQDTMRREFTANVSHELKTPLTSISGTAEILQSGLVRQEDIPHFATNIRKEAGRLIVLVNDIIELSRLDGHETTAPAEPIALLSLSKEILSGLSLNAEKAQVETRAEGKDCVIFGQPKVVDEMIYNLCDNAIKYNRPGGQVVVSVEETEDGITLSVADTGIGIPKDELDRVFERFYRVDKSHSKEIGGTGLGLSIVKHGAKLHGAKIDIKSELGKGTTLTVLFEKPYA
jgi:two-component system phosphate regulon sensor histidine kinase PhoR